jgi:uncharacterized repeat protein (TIGR04138 family)
VENPARSFWQGFSLSSVIDLRPEMDTFATLCRSLLSLMTDLSFHLAIQQSVDNDPRYHPHAYEFVRDALNVAAKLFSEGKEDRHVTGQQVLEGVRSHALAEYGPMSFTILAEWGLNRGEDVGNIVYNLINVGYFGKNDGDSIEDFAGGYQFEQALTEPFKPRSKRQKVEA